MANHYETLGVPPGSSPKDIRKAYLRRARALHPDRQQGRPEPEAHRAEQAMRQVNVAWNVLSDPAKKSEYDKSINVRAPRPQARQTTKTSAGTSAKPQAPRNAARPAQPPRSEPTARRSASIDDQPGDGSVSVWASMPVLIVLGVILGILVVTAFAGGDEPVPIPTEPQNNAELDVGECFILVGNLPREQSCASGLADGQVIELGPEPGNCPTNTQSLKDPSSEFFLCWARMIPGSSNTVPSN